MSRKSIEDVCQEIRDLASSSIFIDNIKRFNLNWDLMWAAMDTIEDTSFAIQAYKNGNSSSSQGLEYLKIYGLFQAIFMQQDAVRNFAESFKLNKIDISTDPDAHGIRELRNKYFGHHKYKRDGTTTYHGIARLTVGEESIMAWTYPNFSTETINLNQAIAVNRKYIIDSLDRILKEMKLKRTDYVKQFTDQLSEDNQGYAFEKLYNWLYGDTSDRAAMADFSLRTIRQEVANIDKGLRERFDNIKDVGDAERTLEKARFALDYLDKSFTELPNGAEGNFDVEIYADSLNSSFRDLIQTCIDVNKSFNNQ